MEILSFLSVIPSSLIMVLTCCAVVFFIWRLLGIPIIKGIARGIIPALIVSAFLYFVLKMSEENIFLIDSGIFLLTSIFGKIKEN